MELLDNIAKIASAAYKGTAMKVVAAFLAGSMVAGCFKSYFTSIIPPDGWQTEISADSEGGFGIRGQVSSTESESNSVDISHDQSEATIEDTGNTVSGTRTALDVSIKSSSREFAVRPMIESLERRVLTPAGVKESDLRGTFCSTDLIFGGEDRFWLVRPYVNTEKDKTVVGDINTTQWGIYIDGKLRRFRPLFSFESYDVDFGTGVTNLREAQFGASFRSGNERCSLGYYGVLMDDESDQTYKNIVLADATLFETGNSFMGADGSYDGDLASLGIHGAYNRRGGNMPQTAKRVRESIRQMQRLNVLERGLPGSVVRNRRSDLRQVLGNLDATLFGMLGVRQEHDTADWETEAKLYAMLGGNISIKGKPLTVGLTYGNVFSMYPADAVSERKGMFLGTKLGSGRLGVVWEDIDFDNRKDTDSVKIFYVVSTR